MEKMLKMNKEWLLTSYVPEGIPTSDHMKLRNSSYISFDPIPNDHVVIQTLYLSIDPYLRTKMTGVDDGLYFPQFPLNEVKSMHNCNLVFVLVSDFEHCR